MTVAVRVVPAVVLTFAVVAFTAATGTQPAFALDAAPSLRERTEPASSTTAMEAQGKSRRHVRHPRYQAPRVASLSRPPFILMIGIGF